MNRSQRFRTITPVLPGLLLAGAFSAQALPLKKKTLEAFQAYERKTEARVEQRAHSADFLWVDDKPERLREARQGKVVIEALTEGRDLDVPDGMIHDWIAAVFIPGVRLGDVIGAVQDYDSNKHTHKPEVLDSRLISRNGNEFRVFLRLMQKKVLTVVLDTEHEIRYFPLSDTRWHSRSRTVRISEVENAGQPGEHTLPDGDDHGFLWRLNTYWRFEERDGGVYVECQSISLSRDVPLGLGWLITPIVRGLPRTSLERTLESTRAAVKARAAASARAAQ